MSLTKVDDKLEQKGKELYQTHQVFKDLANVMEHPEFKKFFNKYFESSGDAEAILMMMKVYQKLDEVPGITPYQKVAAVDALYKDSNMRQKIIERFRDWRSQSDNLLEDNNSD
jgi:hypothetical protein